MKKTRTLIPRAWHMLLGWVALWSLACGIILFVWCSCVLIRLASLAILDVIRTIAGVF